MPEQSPEQKPEHKTDGTNVKYMYCVKCRTKVGITNPERVTLPNGKHAMKGKCPHCGINCHQIVSSHVAE